MAVLSAMTSSGFLIYKIVMKMPLDDDALVLALSGTLITWVFVYSGPASCTASRPSLDG